MVVNNTTDILDKGIRIAANTGVRFPESAKLIPRMLYKNEITKLTIIICIVLFDKFKISGNL